MKVYINAEKASENNLLFKCDQLTNDNEKLVIEFIRVLKDDGNSVINQWLKNGSLNKCLDSYWYVKTYVTDQLGNCLERYNPIVKSNNRIDFNWIMEASENNRFMILNEIMKRAYGPEAEAYIKIGEEKQRKEWKVNKYGIITRGFTVDQCIQRHKTFWDRWPYFNEPRRVWRDEYDRLCIEYVDKRDLSIHFYRYILEDGHLVWF